MKIFNLKKALEFITEWPFWILFIFFVGGGGLLIFKMANTAVVEASVIPPELEDEIILASRFYNSEDCFAYEGLINGVTGVSSVHQGVIDSNKFNSVVMGLCYPPSDVNYAFSLTLNAPDAPEINPDAEDPHELGPVNTYNWDQGYESKEITEDVLVLVDGVLYNAELTIGIKNVR